MFPEVTEAFVILSSLDSVYDEDLLRLFNLVQRFVVLIYDRTCPLDDVNLCRKYLFTKKQRSIDGCPPTKDALMQYVKRAMLQSHLWVTCCTKESVEVEWTDWGWYLEDGILRPLDNKAFSINGLLGVDFLQM